MTVKNAAVTLRIEMVGDGTPGAALPNGYWWNHYDSFQVNSNNHLFSKNLTKYVFARNIYKIVVNINKKKLYNHTSPRSLRGLLGCDVADDTFSQLLISIYAVDAFVWKLTFFSFQRPS